mmetsp:Transcript_45/g.50  ORF Transcript_45/g.50 Transcript_45/m.50 type:complete len:152 (-) Transcript_45:225-680(-)|eukprot:CAMPEP_0117760560 /NCGR_PEP_ID=MMETSP0947-20121206/16702_1 /TAXON_ID=44440 /ORGANISM="Chattonella subsalsa, Strain CCMP2191" /LENGTH=151 /DNA_ID=CAMNT_0005581273 /DNA_START=60 /DNA_END=515 /DNA_ORIENTATION=+
METLEFTQSIDLFTDDEYVRIDPRKFGKCLEKFVLSGSEIDYDPGDSRKEDFDLNVEEHSDGTDTDENSKMDVDSHEKSTTAPLSSRATDKSSHPARQTPRKASHKQQKILNTKKQEAAKHKPNTEAAPKKPDTETKPKSKPKSSKKHTSA